MFRVRIALIEKIADLAKIQHMFSGAAWAYGVYRAKTIEMPVAVTHLYIDLATGIVRRQKHRWCLARTFPAEWRMIGTNCPTGV